MFVTFEGEKAELGEFKSVIAGVRPWPGLRMGMTTMVCIEVSRSHCEMSTEGRRTSSGVEPVYSGAMIGSWGVVLVLRRLGKICGR
jgi:hypothetical protein